MGRLQRQLTGQKTEEASPADNDKKDVNKKTEQKKTDSKAKAERINVLIERALSKTSEKKLATPSGDSAFDIYREVLRIDPNNLSAQSGILDIRDKYIRCTEAALKKDEREKAVGFYKKALLIAADDSQLADLVSQLSADAGASDEKILKVKIQKTWKNQYRLRQNQLMKMKRQRIKSW